MSGHVLLVHDDIAAIAAARRVLVSEGLEVTLATSAADAIIAFGQRPPGAIVLAPSVDGGRGPSVYQEIRGLPQGEAVRFILLGASIPDAHDAVVVDLPLQAELFRGAVQRALAVEGAGWELQQPQPEHDEPAQPPPEADPWRVADPRPTLGDGEPLAEALFGDLKPESEGSRPTSGAVPMVAEPAPAREPTTDGGQDAVPPELMNLPVEEESAARNARPVTDVDAVAAQPAGDLEDQPTLDRAFEELELPAEELERAAALRAREAAEARARADEVQAGQAELQARVDSFKAQLEQSKLQKLTAQAELDHAQQQRAVLEAEATELQEQLQAASAEHQEVAQRLEAAESELEKLEKGLSSMAAMLAAERQAREAAERALASTELRHEALSAQHTDVQAQLESEARQRKQLDALREEAEQRAQAAQQQSVVLGEAAQEHASRVRELEEQLQAAEAQASKAAGLRAGLEQELARLESEAAQLEHDASRAQELAQNEQVQLEQLEGRKQELEAERAAKLEAAAESEQAGKALQAQRAQVQAAVQQLTQKLQVESERLATLERAREAADIKLAQSARAEEKARAELEALRARKADVQAAADTIRSELAKAEQARAAAEQGRDAAQREADKAARALEKLQAELAEREQAVQATQQARSEGESRALTLLQELEALEAQRDAAEAEREKAAASRDEAAAELEQLQAELERVRGQLAAEEQEREAVSAEIQAARRAIAQARDESTALAERRKQAAKDAERAVAAREVALSELQQAQAGLEQELEALDQHAAEVLVAVDGLEQRKAELDQKLQELHARREAEQAHLAELQAKRDEFSRAVEAAEGELATAPRVEIPPERLETAPLRPTKRAFVAGRFKKPDARSGATTESFAALPAETPEPPAGPRAPSFEPEGELESLGAAGFFARCWQDRVTGRFDVALRDGARALYFEDGRPVAALSSVPYDRLEALAQREGLITRAQERVLRTEVEDLAPRELAVRMVELQLLKGTELYGLVRRHMELVAYALFAEERGRYAYQPELAPAEHRVALPVHPLAFLLEGLRRKGDFDRLNLSLGGPSALVKRLEGAPGPDDFGLTPREKRFFGLIDGLRTVEELVFASGLEPPAAMKLLAALSAAGAVEVRPGEPPQAALEPELQIDLSRVAEKYDQARNGDYFEILGVDRDATSYEVRAAFERLTREFHPARFAGLSDDALPRRLEEIGRMVAEAAEVLGDDHTRKAYAQNLAQAG